MSKNIIIVIVIAVIIGGLMFVLAWQYTAQTQEQMPVPVIATPKAPIKPVSNEVSIGEAGVSPSAQQDAQVIKDIDLGDVGGDFNAVDADINSL